MLLEAVDVIALGVELLSSQVRQPVDVVAVVKAVPDQGVVKFSWEKPFQPLLLPLGQGVQREAVAQGRRVLLQGPEHGADVPLPRRPEVAGIVAAHGQITGALPDLLPEASRQAKILVNAYSQHR